MSIQHWPKHDRPRERLIEQGAQTLSDAELLAIFLRTGLPGKSAVELAREMISHFGGLGKLNQVSLDDWQQIKGLGQAKYAQLKACLEMARRCLAQELRESSTSLHNPTLFEQFARAHIGFSSVEQFLAIALDNHLRVQGHRILSSGTINKTAVYPRELVRFAIEQNASRIMIAHNHPSNCCEPSLADDQLTRTLADALRLIDIDLVDHLIVGTSNSYSYRQQNRPPF